jgi:hypothetical protein
MGKISGRKCVIRIFSEYVAVSRKSSKTVITRERRNEGMNPLEVFHTSLRSTYRQKMGPKGLKHLNMFPRKFEIDRLIFIREGEGKTLQSSIHTHLPSLIRKICLNLSAVNKRKEGIRLMKMSVATSCAK